MPGNIYRKKGSKVWYLRVTVDGRELRQSLRTDDRTLAQERARKRLTELNRTAWGDERHTWKKAAGRWLMEKAPELKPQTVRRYVSSLAAIRDVLDPLYLDEIDRKVLSRIAHRPGVTNATRRRDLTAVSVILTACEAWSWIDEAPRFNRRHIKERTKPLDLPTDAEIQRLVDALPERSSLRLLVRLLAQTGMRLEEGADLRWSQVDLTRRTITLTRTKAGKVRVIPLTSEGVGTILGTPRHLGCEFVFWHSQENPDRYGDLSGYLWDFRKKAGIRWRTHDLRHFYAVRYLQDGGSIYDLQKILGHSSLAVTERYLDHLTPEEQAIAKRTAS